MGTLVGSVDVGLLAAIDRRLLSLDELYFRARLRSADGKVPMFHGGWGSQAALDAIGERWSLPGCAPAPKLTWTSSYETGKLRVSTGWMLSEVYQDHLPMESRRVNVLLMRAKAAVEADGAVVLAPTSREGGFRRRWRLALELAKDGLTVMAIDNPFMGERAPGHQSGGVLTHFSDFPLTCAASVEECRSAGSWLLSRGYRHVCFSGVSQGGFAATVAALRSEPKRVSAVAVVPPHSAEPVLMEGVPGRLCAWDVLENEIGSLEEVKRRMLVTFDRTRIDRMELPRPVPQVTLFSAARDRYVPSESVETIARHLGAAAHVHRAHGGHVSSILERSAYRRAIVATMRGARN